MLSGLAGILAGGLLAVSALFGAASSTTGGEPASEPLEAGDYCREIYGDDATAYRPTEIDDWRCSVWRNGVWGLELLDLNAACHWQRGENARVEHDEGSERAVTCTL